MKKAFTLIEVNLAMMIMAGGILSVVGLYAFGFRESRQSREDVTAASLADAVLSSIAMAASATNVEWSTFRDLPNFPQKGWGDFIDEQSGVVKQEPSYQEVESWLSKLKADTDDYPDLQQAFSAVQNAGMACGIVITHEKNSPIVSIGVRFVDRNKVGTLMSMPLFFTEAKFQGVPQ